MWVILSCSLLLILTENGVLVVAILKYTEVNMTFCSVTETRFDESVVPLKAEAHLCIKIPAPWSSGMSLVHPIDVIIAVFIVC